MHINWSHGLVTIPTRTNGNPMMIGGAQHGETVGDPTVEILTVPEARREMTPFVAQVRLEVILGQTCCVLDPVSVPCLLLPECWTELKMTMTFLL